MAIFQMCLRKEIVVDVTARDKDDAKRKADEASAAAQADGSWENAEPQVVWAEKATD